MPKMFCQHALRVACRRNFGQASFNCGEGNGTPLQYSCLENPMNGGAWWAAVHGVAKSRTRLSDFTFTFHFHALEKEMVIHSSVLAWRIPGTREPGGLLFMESHRVGHDRSHLAATAAAAAALTDSASSCLYVSLVHWFPVLKPSLHFYCCCCRLYACEISEGFLKSLLIVSAAPLYKFAHAHDLYFPEAL